MSPAENYMKRALSLARQAVGRTSPNPAVGAVLVRDGLVLGEGFTLAPGQMHAEAIALKNAGEGSRGGALFVTLEPCSIQGRTPPCTDAIIAAGVSEVHVATKDPNPRVNGTGLAHLEAAGIKVFPGEGEDEARELYEAFAKHVNTGIPFITTKYAMTLDGKIATFTGDSRWVSGPEARNSVHEMRRTRDAVMVGVNTILNDNPQLTVRDEAGAPDSRQPLRVILDSRARTPPEAKVLKEPGQTLIAVTMPPDSRVKSLVEAGAEVLQLPANVDGLVDINALLEALGARDVVSVLVEGGGILLGTLFDSRLVDKVAVFVAPAVIGGSSSPSPVGGKGIRLMSHATTIRQNRLERIGEDILIVGYPEWADTSAVPDVDTEGS